MAMQLLPCSDHGNTFTDRPTKAGERSDRFQIDRGRFAVLPLLELVGDLLILVEIAESGAFHRRDVHEHVLGLVVFLDEAEPPSATHLPYSLRLPIYTRRWN